MNFCLNYGGRDEIIQAARQFAEAVARGERAPSDLNEDLFSQYLYSAGVPDPELIIRPSGGSGPAISSCGSLPIRSMYSRMCFGRTTAPGIWMRPLQSSTGATAGLEVSEHMKTRVLSAAAAAAAAGDCAGAAGLGHSGSLRCGGGDRAYELLYRTGMVKNLRLVIYAMVMAVLVSFWSLRPDSNLAHLGVLAYFALLLGETLLSHGRLRFEKVSLCLGLAAPAVSAYGAGPDPGHVWGRTLGKNDLGKYYILVAFVIAFTTDSGAYFVGRALGKHKLAPVISPNKTVEGAIGGLLCGVLFMGLYGLILSKAFQFDVIYWYGAVYGVLGAGASMLGDLGFSAIKRQIGIKDYGDLIPGHGGILDRFDSMMLVAPLVEPLCADAALCRAHLGGGLRWAGVFRCWAPPAPLAGRLWMWRSSWEPGFAPSPPGPTWIGWRSNAGHFAPSWRSWPRRSWQKSWPGG